MDFREKRGIGYCGLACVLCSYEDCPGCAAKIENGGDCSAGKCVAEKGIDGCYACHDYVSCTENMPHSKRSQAFNRYAREFGLDALIDRLRGNYENGITYHTPDGSTGDYDKLETEDAIFLLLLYGRNDPYASCPEFETEHFKLRQVREKDAEELMSFYGDVSEWMFFANGDRRIFTSPHPPVEEMEKYIRFWHEEYKNRVYIRFSVIDKATEKAVGTIELYDNIGNGDFSDAVRLSFLHIDLSAPYELREYISELLNLADRELFMIFGIKHLCIRAIPSEGERIAALQADGYQPYEWDSESEHYYMKRRS